MTDREHPNRSVLITNGNVLSMLALGEWIRKHGRCIAKVYVTYRLPAQNNRVAGLLKMFARSGWDYTYFKVWVNILAPKALRRQGLPASVAEYLRCCGHDTPVQPVRSVNDPDVVADIAVLAPEWLVSFSATERFRQPLLDIPSRAAINTHWGRLPAYAGLSPYFWHLHQEEPAFGVTLHRIDLKLDSGPIIEQAVGDMSGVRTSLELALRMADRVSPMLCRLYEGETSLADLREQDSSKRSYFRHPTRSQVRQFHGKGFRMKDRMSAQMLRDSVRAQTESAAQSAGGWHMASAVGDSNQRNLHL